MSDNKDSKTEKDDIDNQSASSSLAGENVIKIPINLENDKALEKITKAQLCDIIKNLNIELKEAKRQFAIRDSLLKSQQEENSADTKFNWSTTEIAAFLDSQKLVDDSFKGMRIGWNTESKKLDKPVTTEYQKINKCKNDEDVPRTEVRNNPNTPKFHGNLNEDVDDWLYKVQINLELAQILEDRFLAHLTNYCIGKAGLFMRRLRESYVSNFKTLTWKLFREAFIRRYRPIDHVRRIRNQLIQLRQGNDFNAYVDQFQQLVNQVDSDEFSEQEKLHYFIEGLHQDTKFQVISKHINTLETANLVAAEFDSCKAKQVYPVQFAQSKSGNQHNNNRQQYKPYNQNRK